MRNQRVMSHLSRWVHSDSTCIPQREQTPLSPSYRKASLIWGPDTKSVSLSAAYSGPMTQAARLRDIVAILENSRHPVPRERLMDELGVSLATLKRDLDVLRDQMRAPIVWRRGPNALERGYVLEDKGWSSGKLGLPKAWFSASEIYALLM